MGWIYILDGDIFGPLVSPWYGCSLEKLAKMLMYDQDAHKWTQFHCNKQ